MNLVLDTSAYSHFRGNHAGVVDRIARATLVYVPATVLGELEAAFLLGRRTVENRARLAEFLQEDFVRVVDVTPAVARRYGEIFAGLRVAGTPIPTNDIWIAASCKDVNGHLVTFDHDFENISSLDCTVLKP